LQIRPPGNLTGTGGLPYRREVTQAVFSRVPEVHSRSGGVINGGNRGRIVPLWEEIAL